MASTGSDDLGCALNLQCHFAFRIWPLRATTYSDQHRLVMVQGLKFLIVCITAVAVLVDGALDDVPSFTVPSFDYTSLLEDDVPERMLQPLERGGIIAFKNIPNYYIVRERFLASAVQCAVTSENADEGMRYLSTKKFHDGTRRLTLRAASGRELMETEIDSLNAMINNCPGHRELYEAFSSTVERAVDTFASALDQTKFNMGDGERHISARKLIGDAKRLDHFHAYEAAVAQPSSNRRSLSTDEIERDLSLDMHEDHGLFIAMAAPKFFSVDPNDGSIRERRLQSAASGLVIGVMELDKIVRPELKPDELVIMIGTGASRWLETSHHLPPVMHGMRMPEEMVWDDGAIPGQRNLRAWFGKMTLLPSYRRLLETKMDFDEFTNRTTKHLLGSTNANDDLKAIGCAGGRHLVESEGSCTFKTCTVKPGVEKPPTVGCNQACNFDMEFWIDKCEKKCDCTTTTAQGDVCWMLCVARLPVSECALEDQECSGLKMICTANRTNANTATAPTATTEAPVSGETPLPTDSTQAPTIVTEAPTSTTNSQPSTYLPTATPTFTIAPQPEDTDPSSLTEVPTAALHAVTTVPSDVPATPLPVPMIGKLSPSATETTLPVITQPSSTTTTADAVVGGHR